MAVNVKILRRLLSIYDKEDKMILYFIKIGILRYTHRKDCLKKLVLHLTIKKKNFSLVVFNKTKVNAFPCLFNFLRLHEDV